MSDSIFNGGPAFPSSPTVGPDFQLYRPVDIGCEGMSLRDYFAAAALPVVSMPDTSGQFCQSAEKLACWAYEMADEMIKARSIPSAGVDWKQLAHDISAAAWWCEGNKASFQHGELGNPEHSYSIVLLGRKNAPACYHADSPAKVLALAKQRVEIDNEMEDQA